ncbi:site-specific tyrosine recombinase XerD [Corynebacterium ulcerans]|uniref:Tyrosine recombinase XerD n=1 Tax=Corynebacterium ulcerans TaxID=65058 RepID=A0ABD0BJ79_CORUL|nr:site-specific tyrosine recombinase XerD [Corynebacterium ulcerans]AIU91670.1 Tyrosine recombinase [Corynebacterium ulcerans]KPH76332.1 recombinase XerC [Corynebacterium ulcerans]MBH5296501.1 site-specific tyrosine recombinase XerD [Corynebacterium ulcerans]MBH5298460.1 site-specific tyrosine recombinase XerD [Corynebacterium ulcerans]MBL4942789.1 site-specific tyrosine recombinase XerD [Corynebacterium ulcerans]
MTSPKTAADRWLTHLAIERGVSANTLSNYRRDVQRYLDWIAHRGIDDLSTVTSRDIESYVLDLRRGDPDTGRPPLAASSTGRALVVARGLHKFALMEGLISVDVAGEVSPPSTGRHLPDTLSIAEMDELIAAIPTDEVATPEDLRDAALIELLYGTGARISEIMNLTVDEVMVLEETEGMLRIVGKGDKHRVVPVGSMAQKALQRYLVRSRPQLAKGKSHALFLNKRGGALSRQSAWQILKNSARRAGIHKDISPHTLRHSYASHLLEGGADVRVVQELLGHSSVTTTQIYTHVTADNLRNVWAQSHPRA